MSSQDYSFVASLADLEPSGRKVVRVGGRQIVLFRSGDAVHACNNRCPHEGYPLSEGNLTDGCVLTCNWHNWKFDLESGETLVGGDSLRRYPVQLDGERILLDLTEPSGEAAAEAAISGLLGSFDRHEYDRMARELARLDAAGGDMLDAVRRAIADRHDCFEYGMTHAFAAAPDWLSLGERYRSQPDRYLSALLEVVGHIAWDTRREPHRTFAAGREDWSSPAFVAAVEREDEDQAVRLVRGALQDGIVWDAMAPAFYQAALAHYQDFGHALIYAVKAGQLIDRLGMSVAEPVLLALTRSLVFATREDLIPEFRAYGTALKGWTGDGRSEATASDYRKGSVSAILGRISDASGEGCDLFETLLEAAAWQMLHFNLDMQGRIDAPIGDNVNWLDFTHAITFSNAVRIACTRVPELWPQGLLQIGCFLGRNAGLVDQDQDISYWQVDDIEGFAASRLETLFDHAQPEYIVSSHLVKVLTAVEAELGRTRNDALRATLAAAVNRFLGEPLKRKHVLRTARQALKFVESAG